MSQQIGVSIGTALLDTTRRSDDRPPSFPRLAQRRRSYGQGDGARLCDGQLVGGKDLPPGCPGGPRSSTCIPGNQLQQKCSESRPLKMCSTPSPLRREGMSEPTTRSEVDDAAWPGDSAVATFHAALSCDVSLCRRDHEGGADPVAPLSGCQPPRSSSGHWHQLSVVEPGDLVAMKSLIGGKHQLSRDHQRDGEE